MNPDTIQDSGRVVVAEDRHGSILPGSRAEMWRDLFFLRGARIRGGAWGNRLLVSGPNVEVEGAVYVRGEIRIEGDEQPGRDRDAKRGVTFRSAVTAADSVFTDTPFRVRFQSNIYTAAANLRRCFVYGNVYARNAIIRDSIVLGGVFCRDTVTIENSIVATFRARSARLLDNVSLLFPVAAADDAIEIATPVRALSFWNLEQNESRGGAVYLDSTDVYHLDTDPRDSSPNGLRLLSVDQRILDGSELVSQFRQNQRVVELLLLSDSLTQPHRDNIMKSASQLEERLWSLLKDRDLRAVSGGSTLRDLLTRAELLDVIRTSTGINVAEIFTEERPIRAPAIADDLAFSGIDHLFIDETES